MPGLVCSYLCGEIEQAWSRGWQPSDVARVVGRHLGPVHTRLAVGAIAEEAETYRHRRRTLPAWLDQLDVIDATLDWRPETDHLAHLAEEVGLDGAGLLRTAFELLALIHNLPQIPRLCPAPSEWDRSAALDAALAWREERGGYERRHLERIRAMLAKAESTEFEDEAEAFTAKAQELMTRHSIDAALLAAHAAGKQAGERPAGKRIGVDDPYAQAKSYLLAMIAEATSCRAVWSKAMGFSTVFGFEADLASVELLYTSLLVQAGTSMANAADLGKRARSRSFRHAFLMGFATRIGQRLEQTADAATSGVVGQYGESLVPVLAARVRKVIETRDEAFPDMTLFHASSGDGLGWAAGSVAAELADIARGSTIEEAVAS